MSVFCHGGVTGTHRPCCIDRSVYVFFNIKVEGFERSNYFWDIDDGGSLNECRVCSVLGYVLTAGSVTQCGLAQRAAQLGQIYFHQSIKRLAVKTSHKLMQLFLYSALGLLVLIYFDTGGV